MVRTLWFACLLLVACPIATVLDVNVQQINESPGLYYDYNGEAHSYSTECKVVAYVNLDTVEGNFRTARNYVKMSADFCKKHERTFWFNYTGCSDSIRQTDRPLKEVNGLKFVLS
jgi:hypothetical protein